MRMKAAQALMLLKPKLPQALILALSTSKFREVLAAKCLGFTYQIKGKELVSIFTQALHDPNSPLYSDAPFVLKELREETIAQALREAMGNIDPNQVAACAYGLGELKDTAAVDGLTQILKMNCF